ncbi:hypothetical protein RRG08_039269, partial [Elysia crispata]
VLRMLQAKAQGPYADEIAELRAVLSSANMKEPSTPGLNAIFHYRQRNRFSAHIAYPEGGGVEGKEGVTVIDFEASRSDDLEGTKDAERLERNGEE